MKPVTPETPDEVIADSIADTAAILAARYVRRAEAAASSEEAAAAKEQARQAWAVKRRLPMARAEMIRELERLHRLLDEMGSQGDDR